MKAKYLCFTTLGFTMLGFTTLVLAGASRPAAADADHGKEIDPICSALVSRNAPGAAVLVLKEGHKAFEQAYGVSDQTTLRQIDPATNFRLASCSKQFTAMAVMLLVHDGRLRYEDRLTGIFPDFPEYGRTITIRNLLNHTSGLPAYEDLMTQNDRGVAAREIPQIRDEEVVQLLKAQTTSQFPPGTKWEYSNSGYVVLGAIVAKVSGKSFPEFLQERIFTPLGMTNTLAYVKGRNKIPNRSYGYSKQGRAWRQTDQSPTSATLGDGGIYSSLNDLAKWDQALREHTLLSEAEMAPAFSPVEVPGGAHEPDGKPAEYGFGWFLNSYKGHRRMWHYGETVGFRTAIQRFPKEKLTVIILCNRTDLEARDLALKVADFYLK
jgi:CubicO group peptidase (beta-lactamase class C family)